MSIQNCKFLYNYGGVGGVIAIYDYFTFYLKTSTFSYNNATKGGVIYIAQIAAATYNSTLYTITNTFTNNTGLV